MQTHNSSVALLLFLTSVIANANPISFDVSVNTTPLGGVSGFLAFDFIDGDGLVNNQTTISDFSTDAVLGPLSLTGDVSGNLTPGPLLLGDNDFFNEALQQVTFGTSIAFRITVTTNGPYQPFPDAFSFFLLDDTFLPFPTDDPSFTDALIVADIISAAPLPVAFASTFATATITAVDDGGTVPEPTTAALLGLGIAVIGYQRRRKAT